MTLGGWITFLASMISFSALFAWCVYKVITAEKNPDDKMMGFPEINSEMDSKIDRENFRR